MWSRGGTYGGIMMSQRDKFPLSICFISTVFASKPGGVQKFDHMA